MTLSSQTTFREELHPRWIAEQAEIHRLAADLREYPQIAVDTESNSLFAYQEQVCLMQISSLREDFLIDTLELDDLSCLKPLFASGRQEKIFHAAEYDILCLKRDYHLEFSNIFDTMQAARILGIKEVGLGAILEKEFGVSQDKRYQRANWGQRPLAEALLIYASRDTRFLIPLRNILAERLNERGLMGLAVEDFSRLCKVEPQTGNGREAFWRIPGAQELSPRERAILAELYKLRQEKAKAANLPPFKILSNENLIAVARSDPESLEDLGEIHGLSPKLVNRYGDDLIQAVDRGRHAPPISKPPRTARPTDEFLNRLEKLKLWRKEAGKKMEVESDIILPRDILESIAVKNPQDSASLKKVMADVPWRLEHFGERILSITRNTQEAA
jgi:ribonuclease D